MKQIYIFLVCLFASISVNAQDKVMTIDNQTPGWLSSKMTYAQQVAVENLTVTGYINPTDMTFINTLIKARKLIVLNLNGANLVDDNGKDNILWDKFINFGVNKTLQKLILPHNLKGFVSPFSADNIDSLIVDSNILHYDFGKLDGNGTKFVSGTPKHLILTENVSYVYRYMFDLGYGTKCILSLPSSLVEIGPHGFSGCTFASDFVLPKNIVRLGSPDDKEDSWLEQNWNTEINMPISKKRFDFPENLKAYYGGSKSTNGQPNSKYAQHCYTSDTIVVGAKCDTLCVKLTAKVGYFKGSTPPEPVVGYYYNYKFDKVYVPKGCLDAYVKKFWASDYQHQYIKDIQEVNGIEKISFRWTSPHLMQPDAQDDLDYEIQPADAFDKRLKWSSDNEEVATVDANGKVYAHKSGTAIITVTSYDGKVSNSCEIIVAQPVTGVVIEPSEIELDELGATAQLVVQVKPENATNKNVTWKSSNESVCIVSDKGELITTGYGKTVVLATTEDGNYVGTCIVTVSEPTGINNMSEASDVIEISRYSVNGQRLAAPIKGVNIVKYSDGSVRKEVVK